MFQRCWKHVIFSLRNKSSESQDSVTLNPSAETTRMFLWNTRNDVLKIHKEKGFLPKLLTTYSCGLRGPCLHWAHVVTKPVNNYLEPQCRGAGFCFFHWLKIILRSEEKSPATTGCFLKVLRSDLTFVGHLPCLDTLGRYLHCCSGSTGELTNNSVRDSEKINFFCCRKN